MHFSTKSQQISISPYMIICVFPPKISPKEKHTKSLFLHRFSHLVAGPGLGSMSSESVTWISAAKQEGACPMPEMSWGLTKCLTVSYCITY